MEINLYTRIPPSWAKKTPIHDYKTTMVFSGPYRYNANEKTCSQVSTKKLSKKKSVTMYTKTAMEDPTPLIKRYYYATEDVRVIVYSESPAAWAECIVGAETLFFEERR